MQKHQKIFRVIMMHNQLASEGDIETLLARDPNPEDVLTGMVQGEMISRATADKVLKLYLHNLQKQGLEPLPPKVPAPAAVAKQVAPPSRPPPQSAAEPTPKATVKVSAAPTDSVPFADRVGPPIVGKAPPHGDTPLYPPALEQFQPSGPGAVSDRDLLYHLLCAARQLNASDLHVIGGSWPVVRIATYLRDLKLPPLDGAMAERMLRTALTEKQAELFHATGDLDFCLDAGPTLGRFRASFLRQHRGVSGTFRLIPWKTPTMAELKLPAVCKKMTQFRQGIVLVTGPKGSGKTTTLAALIDMINETRAEHIITIEDPIEFVHPCKKGHVNQREVGRHTESFAVALRASLREAPDVIMVGEMRDLETTSLAITAAETGHLVFATLHTPDAARTVGRVIDVFPHKEQSQIRAMFSESLRGIVCQQLIPAADGGGLHLGLEIMLNTSAVANLIRDNRAYQLPNLIQVQKKMGMCLMDESLLNLARDGKIAREEAIARADNPAMVEREMAR
jgi:twitching motility protein PilT